ncbi:MAG: AAA-like domain-containing protein [Saprospiraceae bacterium]|nr:AAA-like domain-containing protein [Saprospiraceae bacterium]
MKKKFNTTGKCIPSRHYMADVSKKLARTLDMVEQGEYFIINRPRQYGKTTTLYTIAEILRRTDEYVVFNIGFDGVGDDMFNTEKEFSKRFFRTLTKYAAIKVPELSAWFNQNTDEINSLEDLSFLLTDMVNQTEKKVVLMIDEVDKSSNNQLFVSFLAMLRNKYLAKDDVSTFHSIVLAGLHDVKSLKLKLRANEEQKYNSPWNIATDFNVDMNLQAAEIKPMLDEYCENTGVKMDTQMIGECLFYHTSGYPFLVSKLCKTIDEDILPEKMEHSDTVGKEQTWTLEDMDKSVRLILKESNTNFDSLIKNLENNKALYDFVYRIIMDGEIVVFNTDAPLINLGIMHGIFKDTGQIKIHNRIYEQRLYNYMTAQTTIALKSHHNYAGHFVLDDGSLDMQAALLKFQQFMKEEFNQKDKAFLERNGRLVFLSFLNPILNGKGHSFKEVQTSEEKRLDIIATYNEHKYILELKRWYGEAYHKKGITQLTDYLDIKGIKTGFLVIFEYNKTKSWHKEWIENDGKRIFAVWV